MADSTVEYYNRNAKRFLEETTQVDFSETQNEFLKLLHKEAVILDFGCGSGRDALTFLKQGFQDIGGYFHFFSFHFRLLFCTTIRAYQISPAFWLSEMTVRDITPESFFFRPHSQRSLLLPYKKVRYIFFSSTLTG